MRPTKITPARLGEPVSRRAFLSGAAGLAGGAAVFGAGGLLRRTPAAAAARPLPRPDRSGIEHVVVLMMENRSFDHFLGWLPGADGRQAGLTYVDKDGGTHATHHLSEFMGCGHPDPDHSYDGGRIQFDHGKCDGFLRSGSNDEYSIGYYEQKDLPFLGQAVTRWTTFDRYFCAFLGPTYPNRFYQHAAATDRIENTSTQSTLPTIWDRVAAKGLTGTYYFGDVPFTALWGQKYASITRPYAQFLADCEAGTLPNVAFVDPRFLDEGSGTSADDHPHADIRVGESFMYQTYKAITSSPAWPNTVFVINYDEWGGFFDHVPPPAAPDDHESPDLAKNWGQRGFRVPCLLVSPFARRGHVSHTVFDHTSILKMIEWRWGLDPLTRRDAAANNLARALDFAHPDASAPDFNVPTDVQAAPCSDSAPVGEEEWTQLTGVTS